MPEQNPIDAVLAPQRAPNPIDLALASANSQPQAGGQPSVNPVDAALAPQPASPTATDALSQATAIGPYQPGIIDRLKAMLGSKAPQGSAAANVTGQLGTRGTPQLIAPEAAMTPQEQFQHPVATGVLKTAGGMTTPGNILALVGTGGFGSLPGAAGNLVPRLISAGFSASIIKGIYDRVPDLRQQVDQYNQAASRGDKETTDRLESSIKQTVAEMATSGVFAILTGRSAVRGGGAAARPQAEEAPTTTETPQATPQSAVPETTAPVSDAAVHEQREAARPPEGYFPLTEDELDSLSTQLRRPATQADAYLLRRTYGRVTDAQAAQARAQASGLPPEVSQRIAQNAQTLKPIVDPDRIETRADVQSQLDQASSILKNNPDPRIHQPLTFPEQQRLAQNLGMTPEQLLSTPSGQAFSAEQVVAANAVLEASRTGVMNLARLAATGDEAYGQQFLSALARHQEIQDVVTGRVAAEAGRALGAFRNAPAEGTIGAAVDALSKLPQDARLEAAKRLATLDPNDAGAMAKFTREVTPSSTGDKLYEAWMNGILSGGTGIVKATSDVAMRSLGIISRPVSAAFDAVHSALTGEPQTRFAGDVKADLYGMIRGMPKALSQFADTFVHEKGLGDAVMDSGARTAAIKGPLGFAVRTPTRFLEAVTDAAKIANYSADMHARAYRMARGEGLTGDAAWGRAEELANNPTKEMRAAAGQYALQQTFQEKLGPIGQTITKLRDLTPGGKFILPFLKTPANILKAAIDYSPVGFAKTAIRSAGGRLEGGDLADALAKNTLGTALTATVLYHALEGNITGGGPTSPNDRKSLEAAGWQPYSLKVGNRFVSYRKIEPLGTVMSLAADVAEGIKKGSAGPAVGGLATSLRQRIARNLEQSEFLGSILRLNQIFEGPGRYVRGMAGTVVPTAVANIAKATDRTVRAPSPLDSLPEQIKQQLESRVPGLTGNVPAVTTPEGRPLQRPASAFGGFNPYPVSTGEPQLSALEQTLARKEMLRDAKESRKQLIKQRVAARRAAQQ